MVFLSVINLVRNKGPDEFWRKRRIFKLAAHFYGRKRNCYSIAVRYVHRALAYATKGRRLKKLDMRQLWDTQIDAASHQHDLTGPLLTEGLAKNNIFLNKKTLADLAIWEPYTFKALTQIATAKLAEEKIDLDQDTNIPDNVISRGFFK